MHPSSWCFINNVGNLEIRANTHITSTLQIHSASTLQTGKKWKYCVQIHIESTLKSENTHYIHTENTKLHITYTVHPHYSTTKNLNTHSIHILYTSTVWTYFEFYLILHPFYSYIHPIKMCLFDMLRWRLLNVQWVLQQIDLSAA